MPPRHPLSLCLAEFLTRLQDKDLSAQYDGRLSGSKCMFSKRVSDSFKFSSSQKNYPVVAFTTPLYVYLVRICINPQNQLF